MVLTLVPFLVAVIILLPYFHHLAINLIAVIVSVIGGYEAAGFFAAKGWSGTPLLTPILGAALPLAAYLEVSGLVPEGIEIPVILVLVAIILVREIFVLGEQDFPKILPRIALSITILLYPGLFLTYIVRFSTFPNPSISLVVFLLMVFGNDVLAYVAGSVWGKGSRRVFPVSPNKSLVGFLSGLAGSYIIAVAAWFIVPQVFMHKLWLMLVVAGAVGVTTILGDLIESAMKRSGELKDSGFVIPGRGGILDSIDSVLYAAPVCYYLLAAAAGR